MNKWFYLMVLLLPVGFGCSRSSEPVLDGMLPTVVATTTIVGDVVARVGGEEIELHVLLPYDVDPHDSIFRPADMVKVANAALVFVNGGGLEGQLDRLLAAAGDVTRIVSLDKGVPTRCLHAHGEHAAHHDHDHGFDPHFWTDPANVMIWTRTITDALTALAPEHEALFEERATAYIAELEELDRWIETRVALVPTAQRKLVTDHLSMGYFADRYGFTQVGVIIQSFDSMAQPAAGEVAALIDRLRAHEVPAIFIGSSINPSLATRIAADTQVKLVVMPSGALTAPDGLAPTYIDYMRHIVNAIVDHLQPAG